MVERWAQQDQPAPRLYAHRKWSVRRAHCCIQGRFGDEVSQFLHKAIIYEVGPKTPKNCCPSSDNPPGTNVYSVMQRSLNTRGVTRCLMMLTLIY